jgi:hypothetical protein
MLKIISTGFEGGERAALDAAIEKLHPWGGTCPLGRSGHFAPIPNRYFTGDPKGGLVEGSSSRPTQARFANVRAADATLVLSETGACIAPICKDVIISIRRNEGNYLIVDPTHVYETKRVVRWAVESDLRILNISCAPKSDDHPFTTMARVFTMGILTYTSLYESRGVKIWT